MRKIFIMMAVVVSICAVTQNTIGISLNPKRAACEQSCTEAKKKCLTDAKKDEAKNCLQFSI